MIKVLVVDDSAFIRQLIKRILENNKSIVVAATAGDGIEALEILETKRIDVVVMDIHMPRMDGLETLKAIMAKKPLPVIMISSHTKKGAFETIRFLETGAIDFVTKPTADRDNDLGRFERELKLKIIVASTAKLSGLLYTRKPAAAVTGGTEYDRGKVRQVVAIGCSTGGPKALQRVLPVIPRSIAGAVLVVQHMPSGFTKSLAERLDAICQVRVKEAQHRETIKPGYCYIAPGDYHMRMVQGEKYGEYQIALDRSDAVSGHRPSVDVLFGSLCEIQIEKTVAVILTGMGSDGSRGINKLKQRGGCFTIAQDQDTSVVFGMPGSAIKMGAIDKVAALDDIGEVILKSLEV